MSCFVGSVRTIRKAIRRKVNGWVAFDEPMASRTWFRVGGPADVYVAPKTPDELTELVKWLAAEDVSYFIIGGGSNLLVTDKGIRGVVIDMSAGIKGISVTSEGPVSTVVQAMAGENLNRLCRFAINKGLAGLNFAMGIPGSVGGAIMMNAGTAAGTVEQVLSQATVLFPDGSIEFFPNSVLDFGYRELALPGTHDPMHPPVVIDGRFQLYPSSREGLTAEAEALLKSRSERQPKGGASAGSFFKNPENAEPAGALIEKAGMKGVKLGGAQVSEKHANFILNRDNARAEDILRLMEKVRAAVYEEFRIELQPEVRIVGE